MIFRAIFEDIFASDFTGVCFSFFWSNVRAGVQVGGRSEQVGERAG